MCLCGTVRPASNKLATNLRFCSWPVQSLDFHTWDTVVNSVMLWSPSTAFDAVGRLILQWKLRAMLNAGRLAQGHWQQQHLSHEAEPSTADANAENTTAGIMY